MAIQGTIWIDECGNSHKTEEAATEGDLVCAMKKMYDIVDNTRIDGNLVQNPYVLIQEILLAARSSGICRTKNNMQEAIDKLDELAEGLEYDMKS